MLQKLRSLYWTAFYAWRRAQWWRRSGPAVVICYSGQLTARPQVHVSAVGYMHSQSVYTFDDNEQGNACARMYGKGLAEIFGCRLVIEERNP